MMEINKINNMKRKKGPQEQYKEDEEGESQVMRISLSNEDSKGLSSSSSDDTGSKSISEGGGQSSSGGGGGMSANMSDWLARGTSDPYVKFDKASIRLSDRSLVPYNLYIKYINPKGKLTIGGYLTVIKVSGNDASEPYIGLRSSMSMRDKLIWVTLNHNELYIRKSDYEYMKTQNQKNLIYQKFLNKELVIVNTPMNHTLNAASSTHK